MSLIIVFVWYLLRFAGWAISAGMSFFGNLYLYTFLISYLYINSMLNLAHQKQFPTQNNFLKSYDILDKTGSLLLKITFPFWFMPFLVISLLLKAVNFWKHVLSVIANVFDPHLPPLAYAILKGNGQYLRDQRQMVLTRQFYDYTSRKFMRISELEIDSRIVELQCDNDIGLKFLSEILQPGNATGFISSRKLLKNVKWPQTYLKECNYSLQGQPMKIDCFLIFNFKSDSKIDLITILNYCSYHLNKQGYIVYGDYFEKGQIKTFQTLFNVYNFTVTDEQDITKNIEYAKKLLARDRNDFEVKVVNFVRNFFNGVFRKKSYDQGKSFHVLILENKVSDHS